MVRDFNFNKIKRKYMNVTLRNGKTYIVNMPAKGLFEKLMSLKNAMTADDGGADDLYECMAEIISNNKQGYKVTAKDLRNYTIEDVIEFMKAYMEFAKEITREKN